MRRLVKLVVEWVIAGGACNCRYIPAIKKIMISSNSFHHLCSAFAIATLMGATSMAHAGPAVPDAATAAVTTDESAGGPPAGYRSPLQGGYRHQFNTGIDSGGDYSIDSVYIKGLIGGPVTDDLLVGLSVGYYFDHYDFGGTTGFGALNPWENIHSIRFGAPLRWNLREDWTLFALPSLRFQGEDGADFGDAVSGGLITGLSWKFSDRLTLGPGIGYIGQIEDSASIFPVIFIDWKLTDRLSLRTGPGVGASVGPGLAFHYDLNEKWSFIVGSRYEKLRFRLDENGTTPGGVGEDRGIPLYAGVTYSPNRHLRLSLLGGAEFGGELTLENAAGTTISQSDTGTAGFIGLNVALSF